ncbi:MAG: App1 family protein [Flavobacterium sp.]
MKPLLKLYRGYANDQELIVMGHVFAPSTKEEYNFQKRSFGNAKNIIRMFRVKTKGNADVYLHHDGKKIHTKALEDGYFKFCIPLKDDLAFGWNSYRVTTMYNEKELTAKGSYVRPHDGNLGFISDIDDTFLVSHTRNIFKKMYILLFRNVNDRKIFEDVVEHYRALSNSGREHSRGENAFFYVSSSEWNLYRFIVEFTKIHHLPRAVMLLKDIKTSLLDFFVTGRGDHNHKFEKVKHILEFYPHLTYTLLGDDSQEDAFLYEAICKIFPVNVKAVYIRQTGKNQKEKIVKTLENIDSLDVSTLYFKNSAEAIEHSKSIGLIVD